MKRRILTMLAIAVALWVVFGRSAGDTVANMQANAAGSGAAPPSAPSIVRSGDPLLQPAPADAPAARSNIGFQSRARLEEHYAKHGGEFGRLSIEEYLAMAQTLRDATPGGTVLEVVRPVDGVISRFDRSTGAFLAADSDGTIRTFFKPNDGEAYFRRQANRRPVR